MLNHEYLGTHRPSTSNVHHVPAHAARGSRRRRHRSGETAAALGYVRKAVPIWIRLLLGLKVLNKIEAIVREEIDGIGAQEVHFPARALPREPYEATHRWENTARTCSVWKDPRHEADYLLAPVA